MELQVQKVVILSRLPGSSKYDKLRKRSSDCVGSFNVLYCAAARWVLLASGSLLFISICSMLPQATNPPKQKPQNSKLFLLKLRNGASPCNENYKTNGLSRIMKGFFALSCSLASICVFKARNDSFFIYRERTVQPFLLCDIRQKEGNLRVRIEKSHLGACNDRKSCGVYGT